MSRIFFIIVVYNLIYIIVIGVGLYSLVFTMATGSAQLMIDNVMLVTCYVTELGLEERIQNYKPRVIDSIEIGFI